MTGTTKERNKGTILVVEDEGIVAADIQDRLVAMGYSVPITVPSGEQAVAEAGARKPDLVLMDIMLKGKMDGIEAAHLIQQQYDIPVVYLTSHSDLRTLERAGETEPFGYIVKPFEERELRATIAMAFYRYQAESRVRRVERWLTTTLQSIGDGVIATDMVGRVTMLNRVAEMLTGWSLKEAAGMPFEQVFNAINEKTRLRIESPVEKALREGVVVQLEEGTSLITKDGKELPVDDSAAPIRDERGKVIGVVVVFRDSSERKRSEQELRNAKDELEQRVKERTAQLEAINRELEAFTYSVSHDLRAPIRAIDSFAQLIAQDYGNVIDHEGRRFLNLVRKNAQRMDSMVVDFLRLSRFGHGQLKLQPTDMTELVNEVIADLKAKVAQDHVLICVNGLPPAMCDQSLIMQVWQNLLSNALKYAGNSEQPRIEISGHPEDGELVYKVADNGVGFDPVHGDKVFDVFQRMHSAEAFEGTGVGLAIVKRIVIRHGGRVWAKSAVNQGATFFFSLPAERVP